MSKGIMDSLSVVSDKFIYDDESDMNKFLNPEKESRDNLDLEKQKKFLAVEEKAKEDILEVDNKLPRYIERLFPNIVERLDISYLPIGPVSHYCLVYKVIGDITYIIPITSKIDSSFTGFNLAKSRFFRGKAIFSLYQFPTSLVLKRFVMPYDSKVEGNAITKACEEYMRKNVLPRSYTTKKKKK